MGKTITDVEVTLHCDKTSLRLSKLLIGRLSNLLGQDLQLHLNHLKPINNQ